MTIKANSIKSSNYRWKKQANIRAKQVAIGNSSSVNLSAKSINELADVDATETDDATSSYDQSTDKCNNYYNH